jgi:beta-galactosidase
MKRLILTLFILSSALFCTAQKAKHTFALGDSTFLLDGKPLQIISGEMHNTRIPREYWRARMKMAKAMGLNTIGTYVFWNAQEPEPGKFDFTGNNDIAEFIRTAKEEGLWVVLRPSPYICAEWEFGGYPWWLLKNKTMKVRSQDPDFLKAYRAYILQLGKQLSPLLITHGGNILMVQIENEYGSYGNDKKYLDINRQIFREAGLDGVLFTCDGPPEMADGYLPGYLPAVNGLDDPKQVKPLINKYHDGKGPYYISEWYPGWFDSWGSPHQGSNADDDAKHLDTVLSAGISINMYMFHGGTTRGFMNGANMSRTDPYSPQTSSYDYDAPLDEAGNPTAKFYKFRAIIEKHLPPGTHLPPVPGKESTIEIPDIKLTEDESMITMMNNFVQPVNSEHPLSFEELNQGYGFVLYRTNLKTAVNGILRINGMRDFATVYMNLRRVGILDRRLKQDSIIINSNSSAVLDIVVENNGRINYGPYLIDNRQGITNGVTLNGKELINWEMYKFPFTNLSGLNFSPIYHQDNYLKNKKLMRIDLPIIYKGTFSLTKTGDTYLDMHGFGKGFVFLNGHNLGKYWYIGPQQTIYVPAVWLHKGLNEIEVFDEVKADHHSISALDHPVLN